MPIACVSFTQLCLWILPLLVTLFGFSNKYIMSELSKKTNKGLRLDTKTHLYVVLPYAMCIIIFTCSIIAMIILLLHSFASFSVHPYILFVADSYCSQSGYSAVIWRCLCYLAFSYRNECAQITRTTDSCSLNSHGNTVDLGADAEDEMLSWLPNTKGCGGLKAWTKESSTIGCTINILFVKSLRTCVCLFYRDFCLISHRNSELFLLSSVSHH